MRIEVTQDDIDRGVVSCEHCPIALAIQRRVGVVPYVSVDEVHIDIDNMQIDTPARASRFIADFDNGDEVEPFVFDLRIDQEGPILG